MICVFFFVFFFQVTTSKFLIPRSSNLIVIPFFQRISDEEENSIKRKIYGGKGDKPHLGGFTEFDPMGVSPSLWKHMVSHYGIKSVLDVGCGRGVSTSWFVTHELDVVSFYGTIFFTTFLECNIFPKSPCVRNMYYMLQSNVWREAMMP